ncbi:MAG: selenoneine biosynthesis selenosugar synthase SenB [Proteobacteria bacterium]|nr:selenoneine biosynthesis selenosugar synthase SenB [Pseudomonadota bacterium]
MARIFIVTPARPGSRNGNRHTATRWAALLRAAGHQVRVANDWSGERCDLLFALHAKRCHATAKRYREAHPDGALVVVLTGTDLYRDLPDSVEARHSLDIATRLVVLQDDALRLLTTSQRARTHVVYQSAEPKQRHAPPKTGLRLAVVGHLRDEKDPFRAVEALGLLPGLEQLEVVQVGDAMTPDMRREAAAWARREPRYRWTGGVPHPRAMRWIAESHLLVVSSRMEGGANVISEAARIGTPVLASRMSGNVGMLGRDYPGFYRLGDAEALAHLILRAAEEREFRRALANAIRQRRALFTPRAEQNALLEVLAAAGLPRRVRKGLRGT